MKSQVYWSSIEFVYNKNHINKGKLKGGFVYVFVKAKDVLNALEKILDKLNSENLSPKEIEFIKPYEELLQWETNEQTKYYLKLFKRSKNTSTVLFDDIYAFENNK